MCTCAWWKTVVVHGVCMCASMGVYIVWLRIGVLIGQRRSNNMCQLSLGHEGASEFFTRGHKVPKGDKLAKRPRGHVITGLLQFDVSMDTSERFSLWKEQAKCEIVRYQKQPLSE